MIKKKGSERGENILYKIEAEGLSVLHCGDLGMIPDEDFIEDIGEVHILIVPTGGFFTIDAAEAVELIHKIEPLIVIPMHYNDPRLNQETFAKLSSLADFFTKLGVEQPEPVSKFALKKEDLTEEMKAVVMDISS